MRDKVFTFEMWNRRAPTPPEPGAAGNREIAERAWSEAMMKWQDRDGYVAIIERALDAKENHYCHLLDELEADHGADMGRKDARIAELEAENAELKEWREGKKGVEDYYTIKVELSKAQAALSQEKEKAGRLVETLERIRGFRVMKPFVHSSISLDAATTIAADALKLYQGQSDSPKDGDN